MSKEELLLELSHIINSDTTIKVHVDRVADLWVKLNPLIDDAERMVVSNTIRGKVQHEAERYWRMFNGKGAVLLATGAGKSKIGVDLIHQLLQRKPDANILIIVPTEKLRDEGWKNEFIKWSSLENYDRVNLSCYASMAKIEGKKWDLTIMDEGHNITPNNYSFFQQNEVVEVLWLSATKPKDHSKIQLLKSVHLNPVYEITLDEAVKLGLVSPFNITVVTLKLDDKEKYIKAGRKDNIFFNTEQAQYKFLCRRIIAEPSKTNYLARMRFIYDLKSKTQAGKWLLDNVIPQELRTVIFCGGKKQAVQLSNDYYFSKPNKPKMPEKLRGSFDTSTNALDVAMAEKLGQYKTYVNKMIEYDEMMKFYKGDESYNKFVNLEINRLACVEALNEGHNLNDIDVGLVNQLNSTELDLWQRIGRTIRFRAGHTSYIIIVCVEDSVDREWTLKATKNLDADNIKWVSLEDLKSGKETIKFN